MSEFIRPQVQVEEINETSARVSVEPLERGYGDTLGNSLRRVLLSSLEGAAVEAIQIDGAQHEFMTIPNMVEDVTDIVLNVKGLVFRALGTTDEATATISVDGPCEVTGADFFIPSEFELVNPEQHIATLTEGGHLTMSMRIGYGRGYVSGEANKRDNDPIGVLDVTISSNLILDEILGIKDLRSDKRIDFVGGIRGLGELKKRVDSGEMKVALALYPVSMKQLMDIADTGNIMPPKTTWFEPKLRSGLIIHKLE